MIEEKKIGDAGYIYLCSVVSSYLMRQMHKEDVGTPFELQSRTPNGRLTDIDPVTKRSINEFLKHLVSDTAYVEKDFNLRIKGNDSAEEKERPYSTSQWHTDVWTGEPVNSIDLIVPIIGNVVDAGLDFGHCDNLSLKEFADYKEGLTVSGAVHLIPQPMRLGYAYMMLATCLHRTKAASNDFRLSLDIRFTKQEPEASSRSDKYIPLKEWLAVNCQ